MPGLVVRLRLTLLLFRVGEKRAALVMERRDIAPNRRIRGLGRHQVAGLKAEFSER